MSGCQHNIAYIHLNYNAVFSTVYICICFINFGLFLFISASPEEKHFVNILFFFCLDVQWNTRSSLAISFDKRNIFVLWNN